MENKSVVFLYENTDMSTEEYIEFGKKLGYYAKLKYIYNNMDRLSNELAMDILEEVAEIYNECPKDGDIFDLAMFTFLTPPYSDEFYSAFMWGGVNQDDVMGDFDKGIEWLKELYMSNIFENFDDIVLYRDWMILINRTYNHMEEELECDTE